MTWRATSARPYRVGFDWTFIGDDDDGDEGGDGAFQLNLSRFRV